MPDGVVPADDLAAYQQTQIRAVISVPLHKAGRFVAGMAVHSTTPRQWSSAEVERVQMVANHCWESIERARAARSLRQSEEKLRALTNSMPALVWMCSPDGTAYEFNQRWFEYTGLPREQTDGFDW